MTTRDRSAYPSLSSAQCESIAVRMLRDDFLAQPEAKRAATLARVQRLLAAETARKQNQPSWLKRHAREIYGRALAPTKGRDDDDNW